MRLFLFVLIATVAFSWSSTCTIFSGYLYGTGSIAEFESIGSAEDCCAKCFDYGYTCVAFTYAPSEKMCYLKDNLNGNQSKVDRISGTTGNPGPIPDPNPGNQTTQTRACQAPFDSYEFCQTNLSIDARVQNLIDQIKDAEIPPLLTAREGGGGSPGPSGAIPRIGLPEYDWGVNCIHGVQTTCLNTTDGEYHCPTSFPNPVSLGAAFNRTLFREMGAIIGKELRALWLHGATEASTWSGKPHAGLDCWSPNININRDPRWGRNQEVPSEDPFLNGQFGVGYTRGLQEGEDPRYLQAVVTLKHWDAYSLEDADGYTRHNFDAIISNYSLADTYFPAFKAAVQQGGAKGVMCSYNSINGIPTCAHPMLNKVLRETWNFSGYVTSDTGAIQDIYAAHAFTTTPEEAVCAALTDGGCDIDSGAVYSKHLLDALREKKCSMDVVRKALHNSLRLRFELGLFDPIEDQPYWNVSIQEVSSPAHQAVNILATRESVVLLKNDVSAGLGLPFSKAKNTAVIGPHAQATKALVGNYLGEICPHNSFDCVVSPLEAITKLNTASGANTTSATGCNLTQNFKGGVESALATASAADQIVLILGLDGSLEGESHDRQSIDLPTVQHDLAAKILALNKPCVIVLVNGGMVNIAPEKESAPALLSTGYLGFHGATVIADTIFGDNENLGGKLPYTIYPLEYTSLVKMSDMEMEPNKTSGNPGRSYKYYTGTPTYPFGWGISLTTFTLRSASGFSPEPYVLHLNDTGSAILHLPLLHVQVANIGIRTGDEVLLAFLVPKSLPQHKSNLVQRKLIGFERVHLQPNTSATVEFSFSAEDMTLVSRGGDTICTPGAYEIHVTNGVGEHLTQQVFISGNEITFSRFTF